MKEEQMRQIAIWIDQALQNRNDENILKDLKDKVQLFCQQFPFE